MASIEVEFEDGETIEYSSKKEMLKSIGYAILDKADSPMTLRQLYYRFVAMDLIDNKQSQYQYLGEAIKEARLEGIIPWDWIEDRTRGTTGGDVDPVDPEARFNGNLKWFKETPDRFERPRWEGQGPYVEVWVEKEALAGVFSDVCEELNVVSFPCRGYASITMLKDASERFKAASEGEMYDDGIPKRPVIKYFGDFDPSGQDIERNIREKLNDTFGVSVEVERVALNRDQIDKFELPPQPAKSSDARYESFVEKHGNMAVELDALPPEELKSLIRESVEEEFDTKYYETQVLPKEKEQTEKLRNMIQDSLDENA